MSRTIGLWAACGEKLAANLEGDCFAKAYIPTAQTPPREDARIPRAHEEQRRPQGAGGAP
jgi:hypothetical protein